MLLRFASVVFLAMVVLLCLLRKVCICFNFLLGCLVLYCSWVFSLNICVTCSCRWFFGKRKKKERWNKTDNKSGNGSRTAWVNEFLVAGAWQEPVPFNTAGHYPSARACVGPFRLARASELGSGPASPGGQPRPAFGVHGHFASGLSI